MSGHSKFASIVLGLPSVLDVVIAVVCILFVQNVMIILAVALARVIFFFVLLPGSSRLGHKLIQSCAAIAFLVPLYYFFSGDDNHVRRYALVYMGCVSAAVLVGAICLFFWKKLGRMQ